MLLLEAAWIKKIVCLYYLAIPGDVSNHPQSAIVIAGLGQMILESKITYARIPLRVMACNVRGFVVAAVVGQHILKGRARLRQDAADAAIERIVGIIERGDYADNRRA